jgi:hypothetical protein
MEDAGAMRDVAVDEDVDVNDEHSTIVTTVAIDHIEAEASVLVAGARPTSAHRAAAAAAWLAVARIAADRADVVVAEVACRAGIGALGDEYRTADVDDSTSTKLLGADGERNQSTRYHLLERVLESRLTMYAWRYEDRNLRFDPPVDG